MKIFFTDDKTINEETINIATNPIKKPIWKNMQNALSSLEEIITVIDAKTNRNIPILLNDVMAIESEGRMCNIKTQNGDLYLLNMRIKAFEETNKCGFLHRINNQVIINTGMISSFRAAENARLEVMMDDQTSYYVNRYYVKQFKEKLK